MLAISRHIESLLLEHECVIIPDFGGFVTHYVPARFVEEEHLFLPPYRSVGFNAQLRLNDGILVQSVMVAEDASFPEAMCIVAEMVAEIKRKLQETGRYVFSGIGTLTYSLDGCYHFLPNEAGILTPKLYALDAFSIRSLQGTAATTSVTVNPLADDKAAENAITATTEESLPTEKAERYTVSLRRDWVNCGAAAIAAVAFYFAWATPTAHREVAPVSRQAVFAQELFRPAPQPQVVDTSAWVATGAEGQQREATTTPKTENAAPAPVSVSEEKPAYALVLASAVTPQNAAAYVSALQQAGHTEARVWKNRKMVRVVYGNYSTEAEAQLALRTLRSEADFANAWVIAVKE